jgi:glucose/arabinose dehydrogenase
MVFGLFISTLVLSASAAVKVELVASGFSRPLFVVSPPGDTNRLFVPEEHTGRIRIINLAAKTVNPIPFLTVSNIVSGGDEQGLLGLAFHPGYATNGYFYVNYVAPGGGAAGHTEVTRFHVNGDPRSSDVADPSSKKVLLTFNQPESNHNGGWLAFGPDGYLYISAGDGGGAYDAHGSFGNGQNRNTMLGKILRIDVDNGDPYGIPDGNPFKGSLSMQNEIWAFGLRNPWRCSFDRLTGDLWIGDVGQDTREEIDLIPAGAGGLNFGWRPREGIIQTSRYANEKPVTAAVEPIFDYGHNGAGASVTGGYVYRGTKLPELQGKYIFGDYVVGKFWTITPNGTNSVAAEEITSQINSPKQIGGLSSFGEDASGELYICDLADGQIFRIVSLAPPGITLSAVRAITGDLQITFNANASQAYVLEASDQLPSQNSWTTVTNVLAAPARSVTLSAPVTGAQRYFRLRAP